MSAKIQTVSIPGIPLPVKVLVVTGNGFKAYRKNGKEIFRLVDKSLN